MAFYFSFWIVIFLLVIIHEQKENVFPVKVDYFILFIIAIIVATRVNVGTDWTNYIDYYNSGYANDRATGKMEPCFTLIRNICHFLGLSYAFFFFVLSFTSLLILRKASQLFGIKNWWFVMLVYLSLDFCNYQFNIVRHGVMASFIWLSFAYLSQGESKKSLIYAIIGSGFQYGGLVAIPLIFLINKKINKKIVIAITTVAITGYNLNVSQKMVEMFPFLFAFDRIEGYINRASYENSYGLSIGVIFNLFFCLYCYFVMQKKYQIEKSFAILINSVMLGFVFVCLFNDFAAIISRIGNLLSMALVFAIPIAFTNIKKTIIKIYASILIGIYLLLYYYKSFATVNDFGISSMLPFKIDIEQLFM